MNLSSKIPTINRRAPVRVVVVDATASTRAATVSTLLRWGYAAHGIGELDTLAEVLARANPKFIVVVGCEFAEAVLAFVNDKHLPARLVIAVEDASAAPAGERVLAVLGLPLPYHTLLELLQRPTPGAPSP